MDGQLICLLLSCWMTGAAGSVNEKNSTRVFAYSTGVSAWPRPQWGFYPQSRFFFADKTLMGRRIPGLARKSRICGRVNDGSRIAGGNETAPNQFPWMAALVIADKDTPFCGGALINDRYVVTTATCLFLLFPQDIQVILGKHERAQSSDSERRFDTQEFITHPLSDMEPNSNDIALVKLVSALDLPIAGNQIAPICMPSRSVYINEDVVAAGWGRLQDGSLPDRLHSVSLRVISNALCGALLSPATVTPDMICAAPRDMDADQSSCVGDNGSPLIAPARYRRSRRVLLGITSWGRGCGLPRRPSVYARVPAFLDWLVVNTRDARVPGPSAALQTASEEAALRQAVYHETLHVTTVRSDHVLICTCLQQREMEGQLICLLLCCWMTSVSGSVGEKNSTFVFAPLAGPRAWGPLQWTLLPQSRLFFEDKTLMGRRIPGLAKRSRCCGIENDDTRIVGGSPTAQSQFPWMAALVLRDQDDPFCGGTLVNDRYVVTAAQCLLFVSPQQMQVILGKHERTDDSGYDLRLDVQKTVLHPLYSSYQDRYSNDIGLVKLRSALAIPVRGNLIAPICMPSTSVFIKQEAVVAGWGEIQEDGPKPDRLHSVKLRVIGNGLCTLLNSPYTVTPNMVCAAQQNIEAGGMDACYGDVGSPLITRARYRKSRNVLLGVTSWGIGCARPRRVGVYTKVPWFLDWLLVNMRDARYC